MVGAVVGSYRITRRIGAGGMGVVYAAEHGTLGRRAAIKVLVPELSRNRDMMARMFTEARATALIEHPGLVNVFDFGQLADGSAYLVMELLEGESLAAFIKRARLPVELVVTIGRQLASAVGAAHQKGIIHRDLKPDNVFLVADNEMAGGVRVKVLDFGIAKLAADPARSSVRTQTGALMGTPAYMSPEQCRGAGSVDSRADIYSAGCILYELLTGQPPFTVEGMGEVIAAHLYGTPAPISSLARDVPPWLEAVVMQTLAKRPEDRPQTMDELVALLGGARVAGRPGTHPSYPLISVSPTPTAAPARKRNRGVAVAVGATLVIAAGTLAVIRVQRRDEPVERPLAAPTVEHAAAPAPPPPATIAPAPTVAPVAVPATATIKLSTEPSGAEVFRAADGIRIGVTPFAHRLPRTDGQAVFLVKLDGYREQRVEMPADRDGEVALVLEKVAPAPTTAPAPSRAPRPSAARPARSADSPMDPFK